MSLHVRESLAAVLVVLAATACDHASTNPGSGSIQFSRSISLPDAQSLLQTGPARVDVGLIPGTLVARRVAIETTDELARPEEVRSRINAISASRATSPTSPPAAVLKLLAMSIELRVSDGTTRLQAQNPEVEGERDFEGMVRSVDQTANTVTLADGTVIHIVSGTEVDAREGDDDEHLASLAEVQAALAASRAVKAEGEGLVTGASPLTLDAVKIEFEAEEPPASQP